MEIDHLESVSNNGAFILDLATPPNRRFPPSLEESFAAMADKLAQFVAITTANNDRLATILDTLSTNIALIKSKNIGSIPPLISLPTPQLRSLQLSPTKPLPPTPPQAPSKQLSVATPSSKEQLQQPPPPNQKPMPPKTPPSLPPQPPSTPSLQQHVPLSSQPPPPKIKSEQVRPLTCTFQPSDKFFPALIAIRTTLPDLEDKVHFKGGGIDTYPDPYPPPWPDPWDIVCIIWRSYFARILSVTNTLAWKMVTHVFHVSAFNSLAIYLVTILIDFPFN